MKYISQTDAAKFITESGKQCSQPYIAKLIKQGKLTRHEKGKVDIDEIISFFGLDTQQPGKEKKQGMTLSEAVLMEKSYKALEAKLKVEKMKGDLISLSEAKAAVEELLSPLNKFLDDLPMNIKAHHQDVPLHAIEWVSAEINRMKQSVQEYQWDV